MKANEAPEKIYLYPSDRVGEEYEAEWANKPWGEGCVEYTRTDAFIDKVRNLLNRMIWEVIYEDLEGNSAQHHDKMEFIEDFKNYMKGE